MQVRPRQWARESEVTVTKSEAKTGEIEVKSQGKAFLLSCSFEWTGSNISQDQVAIGQRTVFEVQPADHVAVAATDLIRVTETFQRFLWLATNRPVQLLSIHGPTGTQLFTGEWVPSVVSRSAEVTWPEMIFTHRDVGDRLPAILKEWYEYYEKNAWVIDLLFNASYGRNLLRQSLVDCVQFLDGMAPKDENDPGAETLFDEVVLSCRGAARTWIKNQRVRLCRKRRVEAFASLIREHGQLLDDPLSFAEALWTNRGRLVHGGPPGLSDDELQQHVLRAVTVARWIVLHAIGFGLEELTLMAKSRPRIWNSLDICGESDDVTVAGNELIKLREALAPDPWLEA